MGRDRDERDDVIQDMIDHGIDPHRAAEIADRKRTIEEPAPVHACERGFERPDEHAFLTVDEDLAPGSVGYSDVIHRCRLCGRRWRIISDSGYHHPTYQITEVTDR